MFVNINNFGVVGDGHTIDSFAIQRAIDACAQAGGGTVVCPAGTYLVGTIELKSHVELHLEAGCRLASCLDPQYFYLPKDVTGTHEMFALIVAAHAEDVTLSGRGVIDGRLHDFHA